MFIARRLAAGPLLAGWVAGLCVFAAVNATATPFELIYTGVFSTDDALNRSSAQTPLYFSTPTAFTIHAFFDTSSPNLAPSFGGPFNGFRAYSPSLATIDIAGTGYRIDSALSNPTAGVTVAIFDQTSFTPGRYGVGLIADPAGDGAGIVGDFMSASPNFLVSALTPTTFTGYSGVGYGSGVCLSGTPPACPHAVTPWVLHDAGNVAWNLTFGNYEEDYPVAQSPDAQVGPLNTARILAGTPSAVPEPSLYGLMFVGLSGWALTRRKRVAG